MKRLVHITLTICATLLGFYMLWVFQPVLALFGGSLAISAALRPLVQRMEARGIGRGLAILIWYLLILGGVVIAVLIYGVGVASEVGVAAGELPRIYDASITAWKHGSTIQQTIARSMPDFNTLLRGSGDGTGLTLIGGTVAGIANGLIGDLVYIVAALSLAYYWLTEVTHFERLWLSLLPVGTRVRARDIWRNAEGAVGTYIRALVVAIAVSGLLLLALYSLLRLPFATTLALIGGLAQIVPRLGPALGAIPAFFVALSVSPVEAILVLVGGAAIQVLVHRVAVRLMKAESVKVNPLLQVLLVLALIDLAGVWAMIYAPPLAALVHVLYASLIATSTEQRPQESAFARLIERLEGLQAGSDQNSLELTSTLRRSADLIKQARSWLGDGDAPNVRS